MSTPLPIDVLPTWTRFNNVELDGIQVGQVEGKGLGFVADRDLTTDKGSPTLLKIPRDAVLSAEAVADYAKVDHKFRQLLEGMGHEVGPPPICPPCEGETSGLPPETDKR
jgi:hypothetical protein